MATATITLGTYRGARVTGPTGFGRTRAGRMASASVAIDGQRRIAGKLVGKNLWIEPTTTALLALQNEARKHALTRAPRDTGQTRANIGTSTDKAKEPPRWADVILKPASRASAAYPDGWRYSHALDAARRRAPRGMAGKGEYKRVRRAPANKQLVETASGPSLVPVRLTKRRRITKANAPYKYQGTARKGKPTLNWFHGASTLTKRALRNEVQKIITGIQRGWGLRAPA